MRPILTRSARDARRENRLEPVSERFQLGAFEKMDDQTALGAGVVADRVLTDDGVCVLDLRADGVDANTEQPARKQARDRRTDLRVRLARRSVLKDLQRDDDAEPSLDVTQRAVDEARTWSPSAQLLERRRGDVEPYEIKSCVQKRDVVAPIAAPDVDASRRRLRSANGSDDVIDEGQRPFA